MKFLDKVQKLAAKPKELYTKIKNLSSLKKKLLLGSLISGVVILLIIIITAVVISNKNKYPGKYFDLSHWELQTPIKSDLSVVIISPEELESGYTSKYFYLANDKSMAMFCPLNGESTPNSNHPRTELRELAINGDWDLLKGTHILRVKCKVNKLPKDTGIFIGQIHGNNENANPQVLKLRWNKDNLIDLQLEQDNQSQPDLSLVYGEYSLGEEITYNIKLSEGDLEVSITNSQGNTDKKTYTFKNPVWNMQQYYFKVGNYLQGTSSSSDYGLVQIYSLEVSHN